MESVRPMNTLNIESVYANHSVSSNLPTVVVLSGSWSTKHNFTRPTQTIRHHHQTSCWHCRHRCHLVCVHFTLTQDGVVLSSRLVWEFKYRHTNPVILKGSNLPFPKQGRVNICLTGHRKQNGHHQYNQTANAVQGENLSSFWDP